MILPVLILASITAGEIGAALVLLLTLTPSVRRKLAAIPRDLYVPLAVFAAWAFLSMAAFAPSAGNARDILAKWSFAFLIILGFAAALSASQVKRAVLILAAAAVVLFPYYLWSFFATEYGRARALSGGAPNLGTNLMLIAIVILPLALESRRRAAWLAWGSLLILLVALGLTLNRAALLGAAAGLVLASGRRWPAVLATMVAGAACLLILFPGSRAAHRVRSIVSYRTSFTSLERLNMWLAGTRMVRARPFQGFASRRNFISEYSARYRDPNSIEATPGHVHNSPLQVAILHGIPGLGLLAWFFTVLWVKSWRLFAAAGRAPSGTARPLAQALFPLLIAFLVNAQFDFVVADGQRAMMFYALFGLILGSVTENRARPA